GPSGPPRIDSVTVEGNTRVDPRIIRRRIETQAGAPLDLRTLKHDLMHIYELGDFQRVDFALDQGAEGTRLVVRAREKPWGPDYLRFGLNMRNDFQGDADFSVIGRLTMTRLDPLGAEWRSAAVTARRAPGCSRAGCAPGRSSATRGCRCWTSPRRPGRPASRSIASTTRISRTRGGWGASTSTCRAAASDRTRRTTG